MNRKPTWLAKIGARYSVLIAAGVTVVLYALLTALSPIYSTPFMLNSFIVLSCPLALAAVGTTLVLVIGGFDLSVAGTISFSNVIAATVMGTHPDALWAIAGLVLLAGLVTGVINGVLIALLHLPSLGVTLATNIMLAGVALIILRAPGGSVPLAFSRTLTGTVGQVPVALVVLAAVAVLWVVFSKTRTGMSAFAIGGNADAARLSGIPLARVQITVYGLAGVAYAAGGLYLSALTATGSPTSGSPFMLTAFAAAALGLVSFRGGSGSAIAAMFGAATLTLIPKFLFAGGISDFWVGIFQGLVILVALSVPLVASRVGAVRRLRAAGRTVPAERLSDSEQEVLA